MNYDLFTSESVCAGHPDKICDQISDACLDEAYKHDPYARVAVECMVTNGHTSIGGEVTCKKTIDYEKIARKVIKNLGYTNPDYGFTHESPILVKVSSQSPDIAQGVDDGGAGDQGAQFGYACRETPELMPLPIMLAHGLTKKMDNLHSELEYLRPDGKAQVVVRYENGQPKKIESVVLAKPHDQKISKDEVKKTLFEKAVLPVLEKYQFNSVKIDQVVFNGTGKWEYGGPAADTGETGRKIIVDSYGGMARVGGGCFSGKDLTKVDRSGAYAARYIAKNIVAQGLAERCEVQVAYVIGHAQPVARAIETFGTQKKPLKVIEDFAWKLLDLSVMGIIEGLDLRQPIYLPTATYGHFGWEEYEWERTREP